MSKEPSFINVFETEDTLRDWIAEHLDLVEPGLTLVKKEYIFPNNDGAGGRVDILAIDGLDHYVAIEVKKTNKQARETLHEISKYIMRLKFGERLSSAEIRVIVISAEWRELHESFSYYVDASSIDVTGILTSPNDNGMPQFEIVQPIPLTNLPQFSPEVDLLFFRTPTQFNEFVTHVAAMASKLSFLQVAILRLDLLSHNDERYPHIAIACMWRISDDKFSEIEDVIENTIGYLFPYAFPGWEPECDVLFWLVEGGVPADMDATADNRRGTPEKIANMLGRVCKLSSVEEVV